MTDRWVLALWNTQLLSESPPTIRGLSDTPDVITVENTNGKNSLASLTSRSGSVAFKAHGPKIGLVLLVLRHGSRLR
jgi:hypothetical protein